MACRVRGGGGAAGLVRWECGMEVVRWESCRADRCHGEMIVAMF